MYCIGACWVSWLKLSSPKWSTIGIAPLKRWGGGGGGEGSWMLSLICALIVRIIKEFTNWSVGSRPSSPVDPPPPTSLHPLPPHPHLPPPLLRMCRFCSRLLAETRSYYDLPTSPPPTLPPPPSPPPSYFLRPRAHAHEMRCGRTKCLREACTAPWLADTRKVTRCIVSVPADPRVCISVSVSRFLACGKACVGPIWYTWCDRLSNTVTITRLEWR